MPMLIFFNKFESWETLNCELNVLAILNNVAKNNIGKTAFFITILLIFTKNTRIGWKNADVATPPEDAINAKSNGKRARIN